MTDKFNHTFGNQTQMTINRLPNVIALDYYDGPICGFSRGLKGLEPFYFHILALDEAQDERLFLVSEIGEGRYASLAATLLNVTPDSSKPILFPDITALDQHAKQELDQFAQHCKLNALERGMLLLTNDIDFRSGALFPSNSDVQSRAAIVLASRSPDDLAIWRNELQRTRSSPALFIAKHAYSGESDGVLLAGLADDQHETVDYLLFQKSIDPSAQDLKLGHDQVHVTLNGRTTSCHGGIKCIRLASNELQIQVDASTAEVLGTAQEFVVSFHHRLEGLEAFSAMLRGMLESFVDSRRQAPLELR
ncbi:Imm10 family immunity protein [Stenotrophomonas sp.]|uniref:Imm10 family immunity protein n=1 Tax=Stenotrophomonas sp. TaxID=69392 RepID=UPI0028AE96F6|nr:Imm10 family immunity protein [Stenotrophomonas sp.]